MFSLQPAYFTKRRVIDYGRAQGCICWLNN